MEHEHHELIEKCHRLENGTHRMEGATADLHYYKEQFEHVSMERDLLKIKVREIEIAIT